MKAEMIPGGLGHACCAGYLLPEWSNLSHHLPGDDGESVMVRRPLEEHHTRIYKIRPSHKPGALELAHL